MIKKICDSCGMEVKKENSLHTFPAIATIKIGTFEHEFQCCSNDCLNKCLISYLGIVPAKPQSPYR